MNKKEYTLYRDLCLIELETKAQENFTKVEKNERVLDPTFWVVATPLFTKDEIKKENRNPIVGREPPSTGLTWEQHGTFTTWLSIAALANAGDMLIPGFGDMFGKIRDNHRYQVRVSLPSSSSDFTAKDVYNSLKFDLVNLFFLKKHRLQKELELWLKNPEKPYLIPQPTFAGVID